MAPAGTQWEETDKRGNARFSKPSGPGQLHHGPENLSWVSRVSWPFYPPRVLAKSGRQWGHRPGPSRRAFWRTEKPRDPSAGGKDPSLSLMMLKTQTAQPVSPRARGCFVWAAKTVSPPIPVALGKKLLPGTGSAANSSSPHPQTLGTRVRCSCPCSLLAGRGHQLDATPAAEETVSAPSRGAA